MSASTVFDCPPLRARLSAESCARNHERAADAAKHPKRDGSHATLLSIRCCVRCPGVEALAGFWSIEPVELDTSKLVPPRKVNGLQEWHGVPREERPRIGYSIGEDATVPVAERRPACFTLAEVARRAGIVGNSAVYSLRKAGILGKRVGKNRIYPCEVIERWLAERGEKRRGVSM